MSDFYMKELQKLNLEDKFLFDETMEDEGAYADTVSILLEKETEFLTPTQTEKELRVSTQLRQVRLDVSLLEPGEKDFNKLNDTCLILIAPFDIFGRGLYRYTFEGVCRECPDLKLNDGSTRIFINTRGTNTEDFSDEFLEFMEYIMNTTDEAAQKAGSDRIRRIHSRVKSVRKSEKAGVKLMQKWEELAYAREEGYEDGEIAGYAKGENAGKRETARNMMAKGMEADLISEITGLSLEEIKNAI